MELKKSTSIVEAVKTVQVGTDNNEVEATVTVGQDEASDLLIDKEREENVSKAIKDSKTVENGQAVADQSGKDEEHKKVRPLRLRVIESVDCKDRAELSKLVTECKAAGKKYKIGKSVKEGCRFTFTPLTEGINEDFVDVYEKFNEALQKVKEAMSELSEVFSIDDFAYDVCNDLFNELGMGDYFSKSLDEYEPFLEECGYQIEDRIKEQTGGSVKTDESCKLEETPVVGLEPEHDSRKSFYGKAKVDQREDGTEILYSYGTPVCKIKDGEVTLLKRGYLGWASSQTTLRHVKEFIKQHGIEPGSLQDMAKKFPQEQFND